MDATIQQTFERLSRDPEAFERESAEAVKIHKDDVYDEMLTHSEEYLRWSLLAAFAEELYLQYEQEVDYLKLDCAKNARDLLSRDGTKVTEDRVKEVAGTMPIYKQAVTAKNRAYSRWQKFRSVAFAMSARKDMLQSANARQKVELSSYSSKEPEPPRTAQSLDEAKQRYLQRKQQ